MLVYHRTRRADAIMRDGFSDAYDILPELGQPRGVFVSANWPLNENDGAYGDAVIEIDVPDATFEAYEWVTDTDFGTYREAMIPVMEINHHARRVLSEHEIDDLTHSRWDRFHRAWVLPDGPQSEDATDTPRSAGLT
jgi:hypothetical protein